jgi:glutathione gamma-glutamylcysteinyltransferase
MQQQQQQVAVPSMVQAHQPPPPTGVKKTFYKRKLPTPPATEFSSTEGRLLFAEALQQGTMTGFFKLVEQYSTQDEPAFCGLASIAMVLNALSIDPKRPWKGSWRWFHEELLDCCLPLSKVAQEGVVLTQAACLAKCNGANVMLHRSGTFSLDDFRQAVIDTCTSGEEHLVVSYTRKAFSQTGDGHFSPIGGYHGARDLVLILDTARFKYPPHWVPLPMLYEAMGAIDPTTGQPRGYLRLSANVRPDSVLFTLDIRPDGSWPRRRHSSSRRRRSWFRLLRQLVQPRPKLCYSSW